MEISKHKIITTFTFSLGTFIIFIVFLTLDDKDRTVVNGFTSLVLDSYPALTLLRILS